MKTTDKADQEIYFLVSLAFAKLIFLFYNIIIAG